MTVKEKYDFLLVKTNELRSKLQGAKSKERKKIQGILIDITHERKELWKQIGQGKGHEELNVSFE